MIGSDRLRVLPPLLSASPPDRWLCATSLLVLLVTSLAWQMPAKADDEPKNILMIACQLAPVNSSR